LPVRTQRKAHHAPGETLLRCCGKSCLKRKQSLIAAAVVAAAVAATIFSSKQEAVEDPPGVVGTQGASPPPPPPPPPPSPLPPRSSDRNGGSGEGDTRSRTRKMLRAQIWGKSPRNATLTHVVLAVRPANSRVWYWQKKISRSMETRNPASPYYYACAVLNKLLTTIV